MTDKAASALDKAIKDLPALHPGPGGAVAVVRDGAVLVRHAWGFADLEKRVPFSPSTLMPICSITKEFTCAVLLDQAGDPAVLDEAVASWLPALKGGVPRTADLCNNQSGLRDYYALTVLCGAAPDGDFRPADARSLIGRTRSLHFAPGSQYSYSNGNFRILAGAVEDHAGRSIGELIASRLFGPAGMETASFCPETGEMPGDAVGYEGSTAFGFVPAVNRIHWSGDAGISACLDDMIAWEAFIDATRDDADGLYRRISRPVSFADGRPAQYGFGLVRSRHDGVEVTGHGGALRGWRSHRLHVASERLSVVVLFNHSADARAAAMHVLSAARGEAQASPARTFFDPAWNGWYHDVGTGLLLGVEAQPGRVTARFAGPDVLDWDEDGVARSAAMILRRDGDGLAMERPGDNLRTRLARVDGAAATDIDGVYRCTELDADFTCYAAGGAYFGAFDGFLGKGALHAMRPAGPDLWLLACQRSMDAPAPGDWTVHFRRDEAGRIAGATIGCWLARMIPFEKVPG
ncbi:D-aminopeptidase [Labrys monachus]|uniref:D-aminopeptidase n=1 Tax=Labrys monachus TaxID=217067 RepID=A0ABU0FJM7_9HYPH|nr:D-aminopeptidase [Labrys monachus]MDQ0394812.1 D-aminopeptidase [Labrys monachus]